MTRNFNILRINIKKLLTLANSIFYLRYINAWHKRLAKVTNLGKLYLLPKIKRLANVTGKPVISNCGAPTGKEFLDHHLKPVMQKGKSYIKDSATL